jgi:small subunit ribosomal protein S24e
LKLDIVSKRENKLMDRVEVRFKVDHDGQPTPARDAIRTSLASSMGVQKERVVVSDMETEYGKGATDGYAKVYDSSESAKKHEKEHLLIRNGLAQKKVPAAPGAAPAAPAAPAKRE